MSEMAVSNQGLTNEHPRFPSLTYLNCTFLALRVASFLTKAIRSMDLGVGRAIAQFGRVLPKTQDVSSSSKIRLHSL